MQTGQHKHNNPEGLVYLDGEANRMNVAQKLSFERCALLSLERP